MAKTNNPVVLGAKINLKRTSLTTLNTEIETLKTRQEELANEIDSVGSEEDLDAIETQIDEVQAELDEKLEEKTALEAEIEELENELEELNNRSKKTNKNKEGEKTNMNKELREAINGYVRSKGQIREGFTSVDGGALIPTEILTPQVLLAGTIDLAKIVNVAKVNSGAGKYPVIKKSGSKMASVAELAANPELSKPNITDVAYDISTYRGYIPVSQEAIEDADYDVTNLIADEINDQELNTKNSAIATVLKTAPAKAVTGLDGLKAVFNVDLKKIYNAKAIISSSLFNELDTLKDKNGRYLLQQDITVDSGYRLFGKEVVVMDDDVIGTTAGDLVGFIGDPKAFCTLFDRKQASVKWVDNAVYGELLAGFVRFDVQKTDTDAGFYVTYTPEVEGA